MNRCLVFLLALVCASVTISSACVAAPSEWVGFTLDPERGSDRIHATFRDDSRSRNDSNWSTGFRPSDLIGMDVAGFRAAGTRPVHFAIIREAGRLDCAGNGGNAHAAGNCRFSVDPAFARLLASRGIAQPTRDQAFAMMAVNVRSELINAIAAARYATPSVDDLIAMTAVGANGSYISELARAGYRPDSIHSLIEFRALGITPEWIGGMARIGYANLPSNDLVQMRALGITADYISGFDGVGYRKLPVNELVQLKALGITPEFARAAAGRRQALPPVDELVQMKVLGHLR